MYKVYCDGYTLHDPSLNDVCFQLLSPVVTQEENKAGSFTFTLPSMHTNANAIRRLASVIEAYDDSELIFRGRPLNDQEDWNRSRTVVCESDLAMLNDSVLRPYTFTGTVEAYFRQLIAWHNAQVPAAKQFTVGAVTVVSNENLQNTITRESTAYPKTWKELEDKVLNIFQGYLFVTWTGSTNRIDYLADSPYHCTQSIELTKNLLDISRVNKGEDIITGLIPLGAKDETTGERLTIKSVNGGLDYITNTSAVNAYGLILGTEIFDTITSAPELLLRGQDRLTERSAGLTTITLTAADLHLIDAEISSFDFLSYVTVNDPAHDITGEMLVTKKTTNLEDPAQGKMTIGRESSGISQYYAGTASEIAQLPEVYMTKSEVTAIQTTIQSEIDQQEDKISLVVSEQSGSYVIRAAEIVESINETGSSIKISADHIALTGDVVVSLINGGSTTINGSKITTGTINGDRIIAGTMNANTIGAGKITVKDANDEIVFEADIDTKAVQIAGFNVRSDKLTATRTGTQTSPDYDVVVGSQYTQTINIAPNQINTTYDYWRYSGTTHTPYNAFYQWWLAPHRLRFRGDFRNNPDDPSRYESFIDPWGLTLDRFTSTDPETEVSGLYLSPVRAEFTKYSDGTYARYGADHLNMVNGNGVNKVGIHTDSIAVYDDSVNRYSSMQPRAFTLFTSSGSDYAAQIYDNVLRLNDSAATKYSRLGPTSLSFFENGSQVRAITKNIGERTRTAGTKSITTGTTTELTHFTVGAGAYLMIVQAKFAQNTSGRRFLCVSSSSASSTPVSSFNELAATAAPVSGATTSVLVTAYVTPTSQDYTYYINAYQNSGSSLSVDWTYVLLRIL